MGLQEDVRWKRDQRPLGWQRPLLQSAPMTWMIFAIAMLTIQQSPGSWRDPSPHRTQFVTVDGNVRLEVLGWGGTGRPVLFIGCYLTGHVYDAIAPKLTDRFRVYALTRRGIPRAPGEATYGRPCIASVAAAGPGAGAAGAREPREAP